MFALPSIWNLIISTVVFIGAVWYIRRYMDAQGIPKGITRSILVFAVAYAVSWGAGEIVDWTQEKISGPQVAVTNSGDLTQLLKTTGLVQP